MSLIFFNNNIKLKKILLYGGDDNKLNLIPLLVIVVICILISVCYFIFIPSTKPIIKNDVINYSLIELDNK
jgi:hypothetical protein